MIVNRISRAMGERRLTILEVANRSGLAYSTVLDLYHDRVKRLDFKTLNALCQAIDVQSIEEILEYVPEVPDRRRAPQEGTAR